MALRILGAPTAAGAYGGGVMRGPRALRGAGLVERLSAAGLDLRDDGDLPEEPFAADPERPRQQNLDRVVRVASTVADRVSDILAAGDLPLVLGGDCTITLGVVGGVQRSRPEVALAYIDGDADLSTPLSTKSGILDAMGVATMLGLDGAAAELASLGPRQPLLAGNRLALIGYDDAALQAHEAAALAERSVHRLPSSALRAEPLQRTEATLRALDDRDGLIVHFDVDVIDSTDLPLAQYPHFNEGVPFESALLALAAACSAPDVCSVVLTEVNPDNDATGAYMGRLAAGVSNALARIGAG